MPNEQPPRPDALPFEPGSVPDKLRERDTWVCWRYEFRPNRDKCTKVPRDAERGGNADPTGPESWTDFETTLAFYERDNTDTDGLGFVVHDGDTLAGIDLDDCREPDTGDLKPWADDVLDRVDSYAEASPSGTSIRLFALGFVPDGGMRSDVADAEGHVEMYDTDRYLNPCASTHSMKSLRKSLLSSRWSERDDCIDGVIFSCSERIRLMKASSRLSHFSSPSSSREISSRIESADFSRLLIS